MGSVLHAANGEWMADKLGIAGEQAHALFLRLDKQQLIEWVFVSKWLRKFGSGMTSSQWQQLPTYRLGERHHNCGVDRTLRPPEMWKLCHFSLSSQTATADSTSYVLAPAIRLRSASVRASGSSAAQTAMCVSSSSLNLLSRAHAY